MIRIEVSSNSIEQESNVFNFLKQMFKDHGITPVVSSENSLRKELWLQPDMSDLWKMRRAYENGGD